MAWELLNSPLFLALLSLGFGGCLARWISRRWQRKQIEFELKYRVYNQVISVFFNLCARLAVYSNLCLVPPARKEAHSTEFLRELARLMATGTVCGLIFQNKDIHREIEQILYLFIQKGALSGTNGLSLEDDRLIKSMKIILKCASDETRRAFR